MGDGMAADGIRFRRKILVIFLDQTRSGRAIVILKKRYSGQSQLGMDQYGTKLSASLLLQGVVFLVKGF